ncbi:MAG: hypothetical protein JKY94_02605 [Rhodobacteraceae bacterium]|nr:hypothetical protein [Paracoccaceae bacterium]
MTLNADIQPKAPRCSSCDRVDLLRIAVATGGHNELSLEWMLERTPHPQSAAEGAP